VDTVYTGTAADSKVDNTAEVPGKRKYMAQFHMVKSQDTSGRNTWST
jgi:hypothetical protein